VQEKECIMATGTIYYLLNEAGRKKSLLGGGDGKINQQVSVELNNDNMDLFTINEQGEAKLYVGYEDEEHSSNLVDFEISESNNGPSIKDVYRKIMFDKIMTADELIEFNRNRISNLKLKTDEIMPIFEAKKKEYELSKAESLTEEAERKE
jgi:hypothetical protein